MKIVISDEDTPLELIKEIIELEQVVYSQEYVGQFDNIMDRFEKNKHMLVIAYDKGQIVGYICFTPVVKRVYNEIIYKNAFKDDNLTGEDIQNYTDENHVVIISIVVHPAYQGKGLSGKMTEKMYEFLRQKSREGKKVVDLIGFTVSSSGEHYAKNTGFKFEYEGGHYKRYRKVLI